MLRSLLPSVRSETRREILVLLAGVPTLALVACAERSGDGDSVQDLAPPATASVADAPNETGRALGDPAAPVTVIEYASMTCDYCVRFHLEVLPELKRNYVATGRVRLVYRDFPTDEAALEGAVAARCVPEQQYFETLDRLYRTVGRWSKAEKREEMLVSLADVPLPEQAAVLTCVRDSATAEQIRAEQRSVATRYGMLGTPTFFVNGQMIHGTLTYAELAQHIEATGSAGGVSAPEGE